MQQVYKKQKNLLHQLPSHRTELSVNLIFTEKLLPKATKYHKIKMKPIAKE